MTRINGLIADIGATNARFALSDGVNYRDEIVLKCADYPTPAAAVRAYLEQAYAVMPDCAALAVAGPIHGDDVRMTNHPWSFSIAGLKAELGLNRLIVMNDFEAVALGVPHLLPEQVSPIGPACPVREYAPIGIIGPGTGLGVAALVPDGRGDYIPVAGEGGHVTAAAQTRREYDVIAVLHDKYRHVSAERVCSGKGLVNLYEALRLLEGRADLPDLSPEDIAARAVGRTCPVCVEALDLMLGFLGNVAGNLALTLNAFGGIYLAGGICLQLGETFMNSRFRSVFEAKGRYEDYLKDIPTFLILHPFVALVGLNATLANRAKQP